MTGDIASSEPGVPPTPTRPPVMAADLYNDVRFEAVTGRPSIRDLAPGLVVAVAGSLAAGFIADHYGAPITLMALLIGLALNFLNEDARLTPGLVFASRTLLRVGIVLIGLRVTFAQIGSLGAESLAAIVGIVAATIGAGVLVARRLGLGPAFGTLAGGSVAICGASAALSISTTLGERRVGQAQLTLVLVGISAASALAMVLYPVLAHWLHLTDAQAGFLLGASIHDVAQSLGAGFAYSQGAGEVATVVKLTRVALLAPVLSLLPLFLKAGGGGPRPSIVPWFVAGFFLLAGGNSIGWVPTAVGGAAQTTASALLACSVTAIAIRSPLRELLVSGPKPLLVIAAASLTSLSLSLLAALYLVA